MINDEHIDYKILDELGKGSYGTVFKIQHLDEIKVLKQINIAHLSDKKQLAAHKEVQIHKQLNHPNIIKYDRSFIKKGVINIIMEYAEQGDLMMYLKEQRGNYPISEQLIWSIAYQLTEAINHIHSNNIIHRDIKPLNIFLTKNNQVKLGDLGVSKIMNEQQPTIGTRVGTPLFLAPELVQHKPYDYKIDIWSLGCVLYYICTFQAPFNGENLIQLGYNIVNKQPKPINAYYSTRLSNFINKLMTKDLNARPNIKDVQKFFLDPSFRELHHQQMVFATLHHIDSKFSETPTIIRKTHQQPERVKLPDPIPVKVIEDIRSKSPNQVDVTHDQLHKIRQSQYQLQTIKRYQIKHVPLTKEERFREIIDRLGTKPILKEAETRLKRVPTQQNIIEALEKDRKSPISQRQANPVRVYRDTSSKRFKLVSTSLHQQRETSKGKIQDYMRMNFIPQSIEYLEESKPKLMKASKLRSQSPRRIVIK